MARDPRPPFDGPSAIELVSLYYLCRNMPFVRLGRGENVDKKEKHVPEGMIYIARVGGYESLLQR